MSARRRWALPLVPLYRAALALQRSFAPEPKSLTWPVVSVGSLSAGGAGKTPVVIALANPPRRTRLHHRRAHPGLRTQRHRHRTRRTHRTQRGDALRRRAGSSSRSAPPRLSTSALTATPPDNSREGDILSPIHDAVILSGAKNSCIASSSDGSSRRSLHLLDDGFQHTRLARSLDLVLITAADLSDTLLPAGNLREPLSALRRAHLAVLRDDEVADIQQHVWPLLPEGAQIWVIRRTLVFPAPLGVFSAGLRPLAFCALARPEDFAASLAAAGCGILDTLAFRDHHRYTPADIDRLLALAKSLNASGFVTTEKDAVKLTPAMRSALEAHGSLMVVALEAEFVDAPAVLRSLEARLP